MIHLLQLDLHPARGVPPAGAARRGAPGGLALPEGRDVQGRPAPREAVRRARTCISGVFHDVHSCQDVLFNDVHFTPGVLVRMCTAGTR